MSPRIFSSALLSCFLVACGGGQVDPATGAAPAAPNQNQPAGAEPAPDAPGARPDVMLAVSYKETQRAASLSAAASSRRAMWSWYDSDVRNQSAQKTLLDFAAANKVNVIYLHSESLLSQKPALLGDFINRASKRGIAVELLFGASEWAQSANHQKAIDLIVKASVFVNGLTGARPSAVHFDIEPHTLPAWATDQVSLGNQLVDLYTKLYKSKTTAVKLSADIALGYEYIYLTRGGITKTMSEWLIDATDSTTVMSYRNLALGEDSITDHATHPVTYAGAKGKVSVVAVETTCSATEPAKVTFCGVGKQAMETQLGSVASFYASNPGYGGAAIHDYRNLVLLK